MRKIIVLFLLSLMTLSVMAQRIRVTGSVVDATNKKELPGLTVLEKGTSNGTVTDLDGNFSLTVAGDSSVLVFSYVGFETQEIKVGTQRHFNVVMNEAAQTLEDVVVVAFGTQRKEEVVGSVSTVRPSELKTPSSNLTTALAGRLAGIISYQRSGEPGRDNTEFFIRGVTTFGYKKDPLILVDNMELTANDLARLQPDDIASFSIMKDATATALYGARGANGVILITTKEGREGKAKVSVRMENSFSSPTQMVQLADPITYMKLYNEAVFTRNSDELPYPESKIVHSQDPNRNPYVYPTVNWMDEMFKSFATNQRINFNISGGGQVAQYYLAATFNNDRGLLKNEGLNNFNSNIDLKQYNVRTNFNVNLTPSTEVIFRFQGNFDNYRGPVDGGNILFDYAMHASPVDFPKYYAPDLLNQGVGHVLFGNKTGARYINPYAIMTSGYKDYSRTLILAQAEFKQALDFITEGLSARALLSTTRYSYFDVSRSYTPFYYRIGFYDQETDTYTLEALNAESGTEYLGYYEGPKDVSSKLYLEAAIEYNRTFDKHGTSGLLVFTRNEELVGNAGNVIRSLPYRNQGLSGRFTYTYDSRYMTELNFGYNGSERFAPHERYGFFPSIGFGWVVSNESFWNNRLEDIVNNLKFKLTYGFVGNDAIGSADDRFFYLSDMNMNSEARGQTFGTNWGNSKTGISTVRYANDQITWEVAKKTNFGIELGLLNQIQIQMDLFREDRSNILMNRTYIPSTMGLEAPLRANVGEAESHGVDLSVDYNHFFNNDFWVTGRANFTYAASAFKVADEPDFAAAGLPWRSRVGQSLMQPYGYIAERLFIDEADIANSPVQSFGTYMAGDIKYEDINKDDRIDDSDIVPIGFPTTPEIVYGFGISTGYRNFDFSCFFQGVTRESFFIDPVQVAPFNNSPLAYGGVSPYIRQTALFKAFADSHWSEDNRNSYALWPRLSTVPVDNNNQPSTWWLRNGSFLRLKSAELGYTFPESLIHSINIDNLRIYLSGINLLTFSRFKLWDTEMGGYGVGYPIQRVVNLGLQINF